MRRIKKMKNTTLEHTDIAILGGGPAGMQAALVASRSRKKVVVFDDPRPPRNGASPGVHNFLGLDGLLVAEIREIAWRQINVYQSAELRKERVVDLRRSEDGRFLITGADGTKIGASKVVLCVGYHDVYPDVPGFAECWANTIIQCPYCDGYENRDRIWGIVPGSDNELKNFPQMAKNWASEINIFLPPGMGIDSIYRQQLSDLGIAIYEGTVARVHHTDGKLEAVSLESGDLVKVGTLLWIPPIQVAPLIQDLVENLGLAVDESGFVKTDETQQTNIDGLWAAGEVKGCCSNALDAAAAGSRAAKAIISSWHMMNEASSRLMNRSRQTSMACGMQTR
jgi:thioredoxin reductase